MLRYFDQDVFRLCQYGPGGTFGQGRFEQMVRREPAGVFAGGNHLDNSQGPLLVGFAERQAQLVAEQVQALDTCANRQHPQHDLEQQIFRFFSEGPEAIRAAGSTR